MARFRVSLLDFKIRTIIGVCENERKNPQNIILNANLTHESEILDYAILREAILEIFAKNQFLYLEDALEFLQSTILTRFSGILSLDLSIKKPNIFSDCVPEVRLEWQND